MSHELSTQNNHDKQIAYWLILVSLVVFGMIILGGVTRLTLSGLSMVDWNPIMGMIPPITDADWAQTFKRYQAFPQYQQVNLGMTLDDFKSIFYFEYFHRLLGRMIGLVFVLPFIFFWLRGAIRKPMIPKMLLMFILGGGQGLLGWYMVKSGLINDPQVSQYRLTSHLMMAILIYGYMLWVAFGLLKKPSISDASKLNKSSKKLYQYSIALTGLITFMIITGGFVAGTKAGFAYNTFPLMGNKFVPDGLYSMQPFWLNWFENIATIQFNHRMIAYLLALLVPVFCFKVIKQAISQKSCFLAYLLLTMLIIQISLGIATLLLQVPVAIAASHQGGGVILFSLALYITHEIKPK